MKYRAGQRVRIIRGIWKFKRGTIKEIDKRFSAPYFVKIDGVDRSEHFVARDLENTKG